MSIRDFEPGTFAQKFLSGLGITEERYAEAKKIIGLPPDCSCAARAVWMNKAWHLAWSWGLREEDASTAPTQQDVEAVTKNAKRVRCRRSPRDRTKVLARRRELYGI